MAEVEEDYLFSHLCYSWKILTTVPFQACETATRPEVALWWTLAALAAEAVSDCWKR